MSSSAFISKHEIRTQFTAAMSEMYCDEVPQYDHLRSLVKGVNDNALELNPDLLSTEQIKLLDIERHGAIRLGTAEELSLMRRLFNIMGMQAVDYYDLSMAGIPVHSTAFRAINPEELLNSPFRIFTSLLRLDLITDENLRKRAKEILSKRNIFSKQLMGLIEKSESQGGLVADQVVQFVLEALEVFRWHQQANVDKEIYDELTATHRLIADVVSFKGPHINHLTPQTLDIDGVQLQFSKHNFKAKTVVEGPPKRKCPILLRQTSFIALEEEITFTDGEQGTHSARFGEVEQRGIALTPKGRLLYDKLLNLARSKKTNNAEYNRNLEQAFSVFPDSHQELREQGLAYYRYFATSKPITNNNDGASLEQLIENGYIEYSPIIYEDFLPVSAAGIFTSNLADGVSKDSNTDSLQETQQNQNKTSFEKDLGVPIIDSFALYERIQQKSLGSAFNALGIAKINENCLALHN